MTKEEKELLLKDLAARLPYGVFCAGTTYELDDDGERYIPVKVKDTLTEMHNYKLETASVRLGLISSCKLETVEPYLRPMSSMTEGECIELDNIEATIENISEVIPNAPYYIEVVSSKQIDWLNAHHFDFHNLIEKGLAIEVTEENNPYEN